MSHHHADRTEYRERQGAGARCGSGRLCRKPFGSEELMARIRAALRRPRRRSLPAFASEDLTIDLRSVLVRSRSQPVRLTPKNSICCVSGLNQGRPLAHRRLLQAVWGPTTETKPNIFACLSISFARRSNPTRTIRGTSIRSLGSGIALRPPLNSRLRKKPPATKTDPLVLKSSVFSRSLAAHLPQCSG